MHKLRREGDLSISPVLNVMKERHSPNGWTTDTLEQHFSRELRALKDSIRQQDDNNKERFQAAKDQVTLALTAAEKAIHKAETANDKRFDSVNEFRGTLSDLTGTLLSRVEYTAQHNALIERVNELFNRLTNVESTAKGKQESLSGIHTVLYGVVLTLSMLASVGAVLVSFYK